MGLEAPGPFPELLLPDDFMELFANTDFTLMRKDLVTLST